jgi:3-hydroxyacyl-CoA dehydrogenase
MNEHTQQKIGVVGGGLMGHGIAYLFAAAGHHVNVFEPFSDTRNSLPQRLRASNCSVTITALGANCGARLA